MAWLLAVCLCGSVICYGLDHNVRPLAWTKSVVRKYRPRLPDINTGTAQQLEKLPGIGPKTAQNIVAYRETNGPFLRLEELRKVKGISKANLKKIEDAYAHP